MRASGHPGSQEPLEEDMVEWRVPSSPLGGAPRVAWHMRSWGRPTI